MEEERLIVIAITFLAMLMIIFELAMRYIRKVKKMDTKLVLSNTKYKIQSTTLKVLLFILLIALSGFTALSFYAANTFILIVCYLIIFFWSFEVW